ncbi:hypothetical protein EMMF5_002834 [Cystobasidiomycetes sp. EMM_F5]
MPRAGRNRTLKHEKPLARIQDAEMTDDAEDGFSGHDASVEMSDIPTHGLEDNQSTNEIGEDEQNASLPVRKKDKKANKRESLMQRLAASATPISPYSKSTQRRMKRKEKQSLRLEAVGAALDETLPEARDDVSAVPTSKQLRQVQSVAPAQLRKGSHETSAPSASRKSLTSKQRQKMLCVLSALHAPEMPSLINLYQTTRARTAASDTSPQGLLCLTV